MRILVFEYKILSYHQYCYEIDNLDLYYLIQNLPYYDKINLEYQRIGNYLNLIPNIDNKQEKLLVQDLYKLPFELNTSHTQEDSNIDDINYHLENKKRIQAKIKDIENILNNIKSTK